MAIFNSYVSYVTNYQRVPKNCHHVDTQSCLRIRTAPRCTRSCATWGAANHEISMESRGSTSRLQVAASDGDMKGRQAICGSGLEGLDMVGRSGLLLGT